MTNPTLIARRCPFCGAGELQPDQTTTLTLERDRTTMVIRDVPADVCDTCGEASVDEGTTGHVLALLDQAVTSGVESEIRSYAPPAEVPA